MLKKSLIASLVLLLVNLTLAPAVFAKNGENKEQIFIEKLRTNVEKQGIGINSKIKLRLKDGTKLKGYISEINDTGFVVINEKGQQSVPVDYSKVKQAKGNNWSGGSWIGIGIVVVVLIAGLIALGSEK